MRDKHSAAALNLARQGLEHEHQDPFLYGYLGEARLDLAGNGPDTPFARSFRESAAQAYTQAVALSPADSSLLVRLGEAYTRLGEFDAAGRTFAQALRWDPNSSYVLTYNGFYLQSCGKLDEAEMAYQRARSLHASASADRGIADIERFRAPAGQTTSPDPGGNP